MNDQNRSGRVIVASDLFSAAWCPIGEGCENCGSAIDLNVETVETKTMGIFCLTLCDECTEFNRIPSLSAPAVADRVLRHCGHLDITSDYMDHLIHGGDGAW